MNSQILFTEHAISHDLTVKQYALSNPFKRPWHQLLCAKRSTTSTCFDSFYKQMAAEVDAVEPYRKSTRLLLSQYFENLQSKGARDGWERSALAYGVLH